MTTYYEIQNVNHESDITQDKLLESCRMPTMIISPAEQMLLNKYRKLNEKQKSSVQLTMDAMLWL